MTTNFLYKQAPNRKGNASTREASHDKGVTSVTRPQGGLSQPSGKQGAPSFARATSNTSAGATGGRKQAVMVSRPKADYCGCNDGYLKNSSYLK
jgi:hypothetical protein